VSDSRHDRNKIFSEGSPHPGIPTRNVLSDDFGWEVPVESVPLPSNGVLYPPESTMHGKKTVNIKAMTAKEEDILSSRALISNGTVILELIRSCAVDADFHPENLLVGDRNALMVAIRITGYGPDYNVRSTCPVCRASDSYTFNLADMPIKRLKIDPVSDGVNCFEYMLPVTKKVVRFKFLTGRDNDLIEEESKKMSELFPDDYIGSTVTRRLKFSILSIDGIEDRNKIAKFVENMPALDSSKLRGYMSENEPGIEMTGKLDCKSCGKTSEVSLPLGASFFWPKL
jgi:hypothetical protein